MKDSVKFDTSDVVKILGFAASLVLFVASLVLPMAYGAEIFGLMRGWMWIVFAIVSGVAGSATLASWFAPVLFVIGISYIATPVSILAASWNYWLAARVAAFGLLGPVYSLATEGFYIDMFLSNRQALNSGNICSFGGAALMLGTWIFAGVTETPRRRGSS